MCTGYLSFLCLFFFLFCVVVIVIIYLNRHFWNKFLSKEANVGLVLTDSGLHCFTHLPHLYATRLVDCASRQ